jgi:hypothetical protein
MVLGEGFPVVITSPLPARRTIYPLVQMAGWTEEEQEEQQEQQEQQQQQQQQEQEEQQQHQEQVVR